MEELDPNFDEGDLTLEEYNSSDSITETLGITDERRDHLIYVIEKNFLKEKGYVVDVMKEASRICVHENELMFCGLHVGTCVAYLRHTPNFKDQLEKSIKEYEDKYHGKAQETVATTYSEEELTFEEEEKEEEEELTFEDED